MIEPIQQEVIQEEVVTVQQPARVVEERIVESRPSVTYSNFRADSYVDNGNIYATNPVVVQENTVLRQPAYRAF